MGNAFESDSIELKIKGVSGKEIEPTEISFDKLTGEESKVVVSLLKLHLRNTKAGYVRINFPDMLRPAFYTGRIYLRDGEYDEPYPFSSDSIILKTIPDILSAAFISKEEAKKEYLAEGNDDWKDILDSNPLPNSIEIRLEKKKWTEELLNDL